MRSYWLFILALFTLGVAPPNLAFSQEPAGVLASNAEALPEAPGPQFAVASSQQTATENSAAKEDSPASQGQRQERLKRILGLTENDRIVSPGTAAPPPTPRLAFKIATESSFDYSSFALLGLTSLLSEGVDSHPQLGKGVPGFGRYYWRGFVDKTDANYLVLFALPTVFHQDERYYSKGTGSVMKRSLYAASRVLITPDYHGRNVFNTSEVLGRGMAQSVSLAYYPSEDRTAGDFASDYATSLGRDALVNIYRELWPDVAARLFHLRK